jgi:hypothetical protein
MVQASLKDWKLENPERAVSVGDDGTPKPGPAGKGRRRATAA